MGIPQRVVTLHPAVGADSKSWRIACTSMAGDTLASIRAGRDVTLDELHETIAEQVGAQRSNLKLALSDGRCLTGLPTKRKLASLVPGVTVKSKRSRQRQRYGRAR